MRGGVFGVFLFWCVECFWATEREGASFVGVGAGNAAVVGVCVCRKYTDFSRCARKTKKADQRHAMKKHLPPSSSGSVGDDGAASCVCAVSHASLKEGRGFVAGGEVFFFLRPRFFLQSSSHSTPPSAPRFRLPHPPTPPTRPYAGAPAAAPARHGAPPVGALSQHPRGAARRTLLRVWARRRRLLPARRTVSLEGG